jgi:polysaccharide pyruvyl transferase WcaK-like protein
MPTQLPAKRNIGIFGHVGTQNLGDETIIAAVIQNIRSRYPDAQIRAFTFNPEDTCSRHGIPAFPIRRKKVRPVTAAKSVPAPAPTAAATTDPASTEPPGFKESLKTIPYLFPALKAIQRVLRSITGIFEEIGFVHQSYKNLKGTDLLIIAGSGQLTDHSGGAWAYPYTFFKWSLLARSLGTKIAFVSIGTSWINSPLSQFFLKFALSRADYRSCRDESSGRQVQRLGLRGENIVVPDLAYSLKMPKLPVPAAPPSNRVVGINPIPFFHENLWHKANPRLYQHYIQTQADFASWLIDRGYSVQFFPTQLRADPAAIEDIVRLLEQKRPGSTGYSVVDPPLRSSDDLISAMSRMDVIVAARYHGVLISHLLHKPVLAVSYHQKTTDLMERMGQSACTLDIDECNLEALTERFQFLELQISAIEAELERRVPSCRTVLDSQYERVFGLLEPAAA